MSNFYAKLFEDRIFWQVRKHAQVYDVPVMQHAIPPKWRR